MAYKIQFPPELSLPKKTGDSGDSGDGGITEGRIIAYLNASEVLGCDIWVALDPSFDPGDGLAVYYPDELEFLKNKDIETLREIHKVKLAYGGGRVRQ
jgi:hypothetical protein